MTATARVSSERSNLPELAAACTQRLDATVVPTVSVVIPVYNQWNVTARCLRSLMACDPEVAIQVIVVDDGSSDQTNEQLSLLSGIDLIRSGANQGFLRACNRAAAIATGRYIFFLNNDTELAGGALSNLLRRIESDSSIGIVGSKLVYPDGRLQEAGGIIWSDASGWNFGRFDNPARAAYGFARDVDYVSGAALLIGTDLFRMIGGFDDRFAPAYYEDADLCFSVRARGKRVVYEPRSVVTHYEGITSGTDLGSGAKRFQEVNRPKFRSKWAAILDAEHAAPDAANVPAAARRRGPHARSILVIDSYVPLHDREAGSNRLYHLVNGFLEENLRVVFYPENGLAMEPYASDLQNRGVEIVYHEPDDGRDWKALLIDALLDVDLVWLCRPHLCCRYLPVIREHSSAKVLYDTIDLHHLRLRSEAEQKGDLDDRGWKYMQNLEITCATATDATVVVTDSEAAVLRDAGITTIAVVPTIHDHVANGTSGFRATKDLLFIGGYNHTPNVDAAMILALEIMPLVWRDLPGVHLTLLGSNPPESVRALANARVTVPGYVDDVAPYFRASRLFVAPLRYGAGVNGKIGHALAFGLPIVTTPIGARGFGLKHGETAMVVTGPEAFAAAIVELYNDKALWETFSEASPASLVPFNSRHAVRAAIEMFDRLLVPDTAEASDRIWASA